MARPIVKLEGRYFVFSSVVDAPITEPMTEAELRDWIRAEHGAEGLRTLPHRLERVERVGTSEMGAREAADTLSCNRAGEDEKQWSMDEWHAWARGEIEVGTGGHEVGE